jgi:subtilisin family serine protease
VNPLFIGYHRLRRLGLITLAGVIGTSLSHAKLVAERPLYVEGEVLVQLKDNECLNLNRGQKFKDCTIQKHFKHLSQRNKQSTLHLRDQNRTTAQLIAALQSDPNVARVAPNYYKYTTLSRTPNDPDYHAQWGLQNRGQTINSVTGSSDADIHFPESRSLSSDNPAEVVIAIIDTGADLEHPDLVNRLWVNPGEIAGNNIDDDDNGYIDDIHGYDFAGDEYTNANNVLTNDGADNDPNDILDHGTHVAGIAAAEANNGIGMAGVSRAKIMLLKASADGESLTSASVIAALEYATDMAKRGVNLVAVNGSYGNSSSDQLEIDALTALAAEGVIFCTAAGNNGTNNNTQPRYPANYSSLGNIISVAASNSNDARASFSNYGDSTVDIAAPGDNIYSTYPAYLVADGTVLHGATNYNATTFSYTGMNVTLTRPFYDCAIGDVGEFPPAVNGNIALIERGTLNFSVKVENAMAAGAVAVIIYNKAASTEGDDGLVRGTLGRPKAWLPTISISRNSGLTLLPAVGSNITISTAASTTAYQYLDGTSMAAPMVTGAIAVLAEHYPNDTMPQRIQRLYAAVDPLAWGSQSIITGRLNLAHALDSDRDEIPDWYETKSGSLASIDANTDSDADGQTDLWEFRAGTDANDPHSYFKISQHSYHSTNGFTLKWPSADGRSYQIYSTDSLHTAFTLLQDSISANPPENTFIVPSSSQDDKQFYKVELTW